MNKLYTKTILIFTIIFSSNLSHVFAGNGDSIHVITHNAVTMVTNPNTGSNEYKAWAVFPPATVKYRKALVTMSYKCPNGMQCGEWDYIDQIMLRRLGSADSASKDMELIRFITPYGNGFKSNWKFSWEMDITDFAFLLHDSVEIGYVHTGYETNVGKGWDVTLDFTFIEGTPALEPLAIIPLWNGSFAYGNAGNPIENNLQAMQLQMSDKTEVARIRINHTGHGSDQRGCSEFCERYRNLVWDGDLIEQVNLWRKCGSNSLYPQGGTWVYDRGNWCPGATVYPYVHDFNIIPSSTHTVDIDMEPYTASSPSGNEYIVAYLIEYAKPTFVHDVAIEDIHKPSAKDEYSRFNPICNDPVVVIRNNGSAELTALTFEYGFEGQEKLTYNWAENLAPQQLDTITLPGIIIAREGNRLFNVTAKDPNGKSDEYTTDNTMKVLTTLPKVVSPLDTPVVMELRTNNKPNENWLILTDGAGNIVLEYEQYSLISNEQYSDTLHLQPGCYKVELYDIGDGSGNGLQFWANSAQGSGSFKLKKKDGKFLKPFLADFGAIISYSFVISDSAITSVENTPVEYQIGYYPNPSTGRVTLDLAFSQIQDEVRVEVMNMMGQVVYERYFEQVTDTKTELNLLHLTSGTYMLRLHNRNFNELKKLTLNK